MPQTRREKAGYATIGTGGALVYGGAQLSERGVNNALKATGKERKLLPGFNAMRATYGSKAKGIKRARAQYAGGNLLRGIGTVGVLAGASEVAQGRKWRKQNPNNVILNKRDSLLKEGIKGNLDAAGDKLENTTERKPLGALGIATGAGVGGGLLGGQAAHKLLDRSRRHKKLDAAGRALKNRPGLVAMGGLTGIGLSAPISRKIVERKYPDYKVTAAGVQRKKTAAVKPSSKAQVLNQKELGSSAFRANVVPTDVRKALRFSRFARNPEDVADIAEQVGRLKTSAGTVRNSTVGEQRRAARIAINHNSYFTKPRSANVSKMGEMMAARWTNALARPKTVNLAHPKRDPKAYNQTRRRNMLRATGNKIALQPQLLIKPIDALENAGGALSKALTDRQKRAAVFAAGTAPLVGDFASAATAARVSEPENRRKAFNTQLAGSLGGSLAGGAVGAVAAGEAARSSPAIRNKLTSANDWAGKKKAAFLKPITDRLPKKAAHSKPSALGAARSTLAAYKPKLPGRYKGLGGAVAFGGLAGQIGGGQVGGYKATSINLERDRRTVAKALVIVNQGQKVNQAENKRSARRKKISGNLSTLGGAVGVTAFGGMVAAKRPSIAAKHPKLADQARDVGLIGGGIGGANALYFGRLQRKEAKQLQSQRSTPTTTKTFGKAYRAQRYARVAANLAERRGADPQYVSELRQVAALKRNPGAQHPTNPSSSLTRGRTDTELGLKTLKSKGAGGPSHPLVRRRDAVDRYQSQWAQGMANRSSSGGSYNMSGTRKEPFKPPVASGKHLTDTRKLALKGRSDIFKAMPTGSALSIPRALGVMRRPSYRDSTLVTRRGRSGTLVQTRRRASLG